jgi:pimeloyl-ACP methyl ester carboxylesterase
VEHGEADGVPVVMLHGVTDSWHSFEPVFPHLPPWVRAIAVSQRGHGESEKPATGYRTRDFARDVAHLVDALGLEGVVVVGHSMGTTNGIRFALDYPDKLRGLVLAAAFSRYTDDGPAGQFWHEVVSHLEDPINREVAVGFQASTVARPVDPAFMDLVVNESMKAPARVWRGAFEAFLENDFAADLGSVSVPTLLLWGDRDEFCTREDQDALLDAIPNCELIRYEGVGHAIHWEQPQRFAADVLEFVDGLG